MTLNPNSEPLPLRDVREELSVFGDLPRNRKNDPVGIVVGTMLGDDDSAVCTRIEVYQAPHKLSPAAAESCSAPVISPVSARRQNDLAVAAVYAAFKGKSTDLIQHIAKYGASPRDIAAIWLDQDNFKMTPGVRRAILLMIEEEKRKRAIDDEDLIDAPHL